VREGGSGGALRIPLLPTSSLPLTSWPALLHPLPPPHADFQLLYLLNYSCEVLGEGVLSPYPRLAALRSCLNADPRMVAHSAQHAQGLVTPTYMHEVRHAQEPLKA
jgi:hypothetical protein